MPEAVHILTHEFSPFKGGISVYVQETALAFVRAGHATTVWAPDYGQQMEDAQPFLVRRVRMRGKQDWLCRLRMAKALRKAYPDGRIPGTVLLAEPGPVRLWMYETPMRLPKPDQLALILHGSEIKTLSRPAYRLDRFRNLLRRVDIIGVVSSEVRALLDAVCPEVGDQVVRVPGAVRSAWSDLPAIPWDGHQLTQVIQVGRVHPRKGQLVLVEAVALLPETVRKRIQVRLIGPVSRSAYARQVESRIHELDLPVFLEGPLDDTALKNALGSAGILVMPSRPYQSSIEGLGLTLLEAAHFGCAVIGSRIGGIPEAMEEGETGLLIPPDDPKALANALERLLMDAVLASRMGTAGAAFVRRTFSWDVNSRWLAGQSSR